MKEIAFKAFIKKANIILENITIFPENRNIGIDAEALKETVEAYGLILEDDGDFILDRAGNKLCEVIGGEDWYWIEGGNYDLVQYIGLKDRGGLGVKVFEGDILKHEYANLSDWVVTFENGAFGIKNMLSDGSLQHVFYPCTGLESFFVDRKVIGSIYEKSEIGFAEGEICNRDRCEGIIQADPVENCSCHLSPPCSSCVDQRHFCSICDYDSTNE